MLRAASTRLARRLHTSRAVLAGTHAAPLQRGFTAARCHFLT
jgi:hypothetical protein